MHKDIILAPENMFSDNMSGTTGVPSGNQTLAEGDRFFGNHSILITNKEIIFPERVWARD